MMSTSNTRSFAEVQGNTSYHPVLLSLVSRVTEVVQQNDAAGAGNKEWPAFDGMWAARISINDFMVRVCKYAACSPAVFQVMAVYLDRAAQRLAFTTINVHRVLLAAFIAAAKYLDDQRISLQHYANIAGLPLEDVRAVEAGFLHLMDWDLWVEKDEADNAQNLSFTTPVALPLSPTSSENSGMFSAQSGSPQPSLATPPQGHLAGLQEQMLCLSLAPPPQQPPQPQPAAALHPMLVAPQPFLAAAPVAGAPMLVNVGAAPQYIPILTMQQLAQHQQALMAQQMFMAQQQQQQQQIAVAPINAAFDS